MKKYAIQLVSGIFVALGMIVAFNWLIDPYDILRTPDIEGLNRYKSEIESHTRLTKAYRVEEVRPEAVLLASSRGLVVPEDYFSGETLTGYNLSLASGSTYELSRMLQHAQALNPLNRVVLALDEGFTDTVQPNFAEDRLAVDANGDTNYKRWPQKLVDFSSALLSTSALRSSIRTLRMQHKDPGNIGIKTAEADRIARAGGHRQMFRNMEASIFYGYRGTLKTCNTSQGNIGAQLKSAEYFERMIDLAYKNNIGFYVYFSPSHARLYEAYCMTGRWQNIENIKRTAVNIINSKAAEYGRLPFPVWDFSGYNSITTEAVPAKGDVASVMKWYWEGSHYTKATARLIFNRIFNTGDVPRDFGIRLTADNIEQHLAEIRAGREKYISTHTDDIAELHSLFTEITKR